jgi:hypothetical protein
MNRNQIETALRELASLLERNGKQMDILVCGGTWMMLVAETRATTHDIDALMHFTLRPTSEILQVAEQQGLPDDWINSAASQFVREDRAWQLEDNTVWLAEPGLNVFMASPRLMLAMKALAAVSRAGCTGQDAEDLRFLLEACAVSRNDQVLDYVERWTPGWMMDPVRRDFLCDLIGDLLERTTHDPS